MIGAVAVAVALLLFSGPLGIALFLLAHVTAVPIFFAAGKNQTKARKERARFRSATAVRGDTLKKMRAWRRRR